MDSALEHKGDGVLLEFSTKENELRYRSRTSYESHVGEIELMELDKVARLISLSQGDNCP